MIDNVGNRLLKRVLDGLQIQYNPTLTRAELELLDKKLLTQMMRNRIVLAFNKPPMWNKFELDKIDSVQNLKNEYRNIFSITERYAAYFVTNV